MTVTAIPKPSMGSTTMNLPMQQHKHMIQIICQQPIQYSVFMCQYSAFGIRYSVYVVFRVLYSVFGIPCSVFRIWYTVFHVHFCVDYLVCW